MTSSQSLRFGAVAPSRAEADKVVLNDPDIRMTLTPERALPYAQFMNKIGTLKNRPESWKDLFFPEVHDLPGS